MKLLTLAFVLSAGSAFANEALLQDERYYTIDSVEIEEVTELDRALEGRLFHQDPPGGEKPDLGDILDETDVVLDKIIAIGDKIWKIIEKNKPVVDTSYQAMQLLPAGAKAWHQLSGWATPESRVYRMTYKNMYGMKVVDFAYRIAYTYGGSVKGKGLYIANMEIEPRSLDVAWGYKFSAAGQVLNAHNAGTEANPMAGGEMRLNWRVNTVMKHSEDSARFFIRGDGLFKNMTDGTLPSN